MAGSRAQHTSAHRKLTGMSPVFSGVDGSFSGNPPWVIRDRFAARYGRNGEVHARDSRLGPLVAIKVPPFDRERSRRLAYFEPEAKVFASLNFGF